MVLRGMSAAAFLAVYVLVSFSATPNPMMALWRPLLVAAGVGIILQLGCTAVLRNGARAALVASAIALLLTAAWVPLAVTAAGIAWLTAIHFSRRSRGAALLTYNPQTLSTNLVAFALVFAAIASIPVVAWAITSAAATPDQVSRGSGAEGLT